MGGLCRQCLYRTGRTRALVSAGSIKPRRKALRSVPVSTGKPVRSANWVQHHVGSEERCCQHVVSNRDGKPCGQCPSALASQCAPRIGSSVTLGMKDVVVSGQYQTTTESPAVSARQRWRASALRELGPASRWGWRTLLSAGSIKPRRKALRSVPVSAGVPARFANCLRGAPRDQRIACGGR